MDLKDMGYAVGKWVDLAQDRNQWQAYVRVVMIIQVP